MNGGLTMVFVFICSFLRVDFAYAEPCAWQDGGYCVATLAEETLRVAKENQVWAATGGPPLLTSGVACYNFYDAVWTSGLFPDREKAFEEAAAAGGTKIGGINLVVLAARTLQAMVDAKMITLDEAQAMLNRAKLEGQQ